LRAALSGLLGRIRGGDARVEQPIGLRHRRRDFVYNSHVAVRSTAGVRSAGFRFSGHRPFELHREALFRRNTDDRTQTQYAGVASSWPLVSSHPLRQGRRVYTGAVSQLPLLRRVVPHCRSESLADHVIPPLPFTVRFRSTGDCTLRWCCCWVLLL
jgi:hypothetical protein